jgi:hypothetical protein
MQMRVSRRLTVLLPPIVSAQYSESVGTVYSWRQWYLGAAPPIIGRDEGVDEVEK